MDFSRRNKAIDGEARDIESKIVNGPRLLHPCDCGACLQVVSEPCDDDARMASVGDHHALHRPIVLDSRGHGGFPVRGLGPRGLYPGQVRVLQVKEEPASLAE